MYSRKISESAKEEFSTSRGVNVTFVDPAKKYKKSKNGNLEIVLTNYDTYMNVAGAEYIPYRNLMINPLNKSRRSISYEKVDDEEEGLGEIATMLYDDPVRIWKGFSRGDIIKITRSDGKIYYRKVGR